MNRTILSIAAVSTTFFVSNALAIDWNDRAARACRQANVASTQCAERAALVRQAMAAASEGQGREFSGAAEALAAYVVLERLYPAAQPGLEVDLAVAAADFPECQAKADAFAAGRRAAESMLAGR